MLKHPNYKPGAGSDGSQSRYGATVELEKKNCGWLLAKWRSKRCKGSHTFLSTNGNMQLAAGAFKLRERQTDW